MIYHILPGGSRHHLAGMLPFLAGLGTAANTPTRFVLFGGTEGHVREHLKASGVALDDYSYTFVNRSLPSLCRFFLKMGATDVVVLHSALTRYIWFLLLLFPSLWPRIVWMPWGADVAGPYRRWQKLRPYQLLSQLWFVSFRVVVRRLGAVGAILPQEREFISEIVGATPHFCDIKYSRPYRSEIPFYRAGVQGSTVRILLGNSASASNRHLEALDLLARFATEPIEIVCPLGYSGEESYRERVVERGTALFGSKFVPLRELLPRSEYWRFCDTIDVHVQNAACQSGLANVGYMMYSGRKVFLSASSPSYEYLTHAGAFVFAAEQLAHMPFEAIRTPLAPAQQEKNRQVWREWKDAEANVQRWNELLNRLSHTT